jgi:hypothetical protein
MTLGCLLGGLRSSQVFLIEGDQLGERLTNWFSLIPEYAGRRSICTRRVIGRYPHQC